MEWTPEGAAERLLKVVERRARGIRMTGLISWADSHGIDDLEHALAHIATLTAQAQAWEQERASLVAQLQARDSYAEICSCDSPPEHKRADHCRICDDVVFADDRRAHFLEEHPRSTESILDYAGRPTAQEGA